MTDTTMPAKTKIDWRQIKSAALNTSLFAGAAYLVWTIGTLAIDRARLEERLWAYESGRLAQCAQPKTNTEQIIMMPALPKLAPK